MISAKKWINLLKQLSVSITSVFKVNICEKYWFFIHANVSWYRDNILETMKIGDIRRGGTANLFVMCLICISEILFL